MAETVSFTVTLTREAIAMMAQLKPLGVWGKKRAVIARNLIDDRLKGMLAERIVTPPSSEEVEAAHLVD